MRIHLPNSAFLGNIDAFLRSFDPSNLKSLTITSNQKWIAVHPVVLSMLAALGMNVKKEKITCEPLEAKSKHYLERMGLFKFLGVPSGMTITAHEPAGRFIPLTQIQESKKLTEFLTEMTPLLHLDPKHAKPIRYIMSELVRNVIEHARAPHGALLSAQYFKKTNTIRIGVADTGVGILETIRNAYPADNDLDALRLALMPGVTGTTRKEGGTEFNAGAGLFFIKSIATVNRDFFMLYSGRGMYKLLKRKTGTIRLHADPSKDRHAGSNAFPFWQGTVAGIDISLSATEEFSTLLDLIRDTYAEAVRERKKERYKKPKFI